MYEQSVNIKRYNVTAAELIAALQKFPPIYTVEIYVPAPDDYDLPTFYDTIEVGEGSTSDGPGHVVLTLR